jgi:hypothetical protein
MPNSTLQTQENKNITTINNEREIGEDGSGSSGQVTSQTDWDYEGKEKGQISESKCSTRPCALRCYLIYSFSSSCNHAFALTFYVSSFGIDKMRSYVCTCALVS